MPADVDPPRAVRRRTRGRAAPSALVEVLRLCCVVLGAGLGFELGQALDADEAVLGPGTGLLLGVALGTAVGFVLGGVLGRGTLSVARAASGATAHVPAERVVARGFGLGAGILLGSLTAWPVFLVLRPLFSVPLFVAAVVVAGFVGGLLGEGREDEVLRLFGARAGLGERPPAVSALPRLVDPAVLVDGRVLDVVRAGFLHGRLLVPAAAVVRLERWAEGGGTEDEGPPDVLRGRGRRALETLAALGREPGVVVDVLRDAGSGVPAGEEDVEVEAVLVREALDRGAPLLLLDPALGRAAHLAGVRVMDLAALGRALRPPVTAGDELAVLVVRPGKEPGQGVGFLDDGTMVVVEGAADRAGADVRLAVTSVLTNANGRMVFGRPLDAPPPSRPGTSAVARPALPQRPRPRPPVRR